MDPPPGSGVGHKPVTGTHGARRPEARAGVPIYKRVLYATRRPSSNFKPRREMATGVFEILGPYLVNAVAVPSDPNPYPFNKSVGLRDGVHFVAATQCATRGTPPLPTGKNQGMHKVLGLTPK